MALTWNYKGILLAAGGALLALPAAAAESGEKAGLPQLDTKLFPEQLFWFVVTFGILYCLMAFVALPRVRKTQDNREDTIASELAAAMAANDKAKAMIAQYEKALVDARAKAQATVSEITAAAAKQSAEKQAVQQQDLAKRLHDAEAKIKTARDAALKDIANSAAGLANDIVESVTGTKGEGMSDLLKDPMFFYGIAFAIFMVFAVIYGRKPAMSWLDSEILKIRSELDQAKQLRQEAEIILGEYKAKQADALAEAEAIIAHAKQQAESLKAQAEADLATALKRHEQQALDRIHLAETEAVADVRAAAIDKAVAMAQDILTKKLDDASASKLIDQAIADMPKAKTKAKAA